MGTTKEIGKPIPPQRTSIADALFSRVQQRVLGVLFTNPSRSFYANEIIGLAESGSGAVQRELSRLEASGLIATERVGRLKFFRANRASPVFPELHVLVLKTFGVADVLTATLSPHRRAIRAAFVYGSVAKREDAASSDIDLFIVSDTLSYADLFRDIEAASAQLGRAVNPTIYALADVRKKVSTGRSFVTRVLAQPKIWVIGSEDDLST